MGVEVISDNEWLVFEQMEALKEIVEKASDTEISSEIKGKLKLNIDRCN